MNTITVKNLSTFIDSAALVRVAHLVAGDEYNAIHNSAGIKIVNISRKGNVYTVTDKEEHHD